MELSDQDIFSSIKNFDPCRRWFYRSIGSDHSLITSLYELVGIFVFIDIVSLAL